MIPGINGNMNELKSTQLNAAPGTLWDTGDGGAQGQNSGSMQIISTGGFTGTVILEGTNDGGTTWEVIPMSPLITGQEDVLSRALTGTVTFSVFHMRMRARANALSAGLLAAPAQLSPIVRPVNPSAAVTTKYRLVAAATTNLTLIKAGIVNLVGGFLVNTSAAIKCVRLFDKATAPLVADVPALTLPLAANAIMPLNSIFGEAGFPFALGLGLNITGVIADTDGTPIAAGDVIVHLLYT